MMKVLILALAVVGAAAVQVRNPDAADQPRPTTALKLNQQDSPVEMVANAKGFLNGGALTPTSDIVKMHDKAQITKLKEDGKISEGFPNLAFVHIPKNGGSQIMKASTAIFPYGFGLNTNLALNTMIPKDKRGPNHCFVEQLPPKEVAAIYGNKVSQDMYEKRQVFCAVRNPHDRAVSQYLAQGKACDAAEMNKWLTTELTAFQKGDYLRNSCGHIPQVDFLEGPGACTHVLDADNLEQDFNKLMADNGYSLKLAQEDKSQAPECAHKLTAANLTDHTKKLIQVVYERDFEELGPKYGWSEESLSNQIKNFILAPINALTSALQTSE